MAISLKTVAAYQWLSDLFANRKPLSDMAQLSSIHRSSTESFPDFDPNYFGGRSTDYSPEFDITIVAPTKPKHVSALGMDSPLFNDYSSGPTVMNEADIEKAPMAPEHKEIVLSHYFRLKKTIYTREKLREYCYSPQQAARESLARMTLVYRSQTEYWNSLSDGDRDEFLETMVHDMVDAALFSERRRLDHSTPVTINPILLGREQEVEMLMQQIYNGHVDDYSERLTKPSTKILDSELSPSELGRRRHSHHGLRPDIFEVESSHSTAKIVGCEERDQAVCLKLTIIQQEFQDEKADLRLRASQEPGSPEAKRRIRVGGPISPVIARRLDADFQRLEPNAVGSYFPFGKCT